MSEAVSKFIEAKGGTHVIGAALSLRPVSIRAWRKRGIPRERWPDLVAAFPDVSFEDLQKIEAA